ncbi:endocuticle structural glycoprotein SgAbd-9-like [Ischnura elegans]|uniref:endocuticle structural glycoprotein SgAbd-9-like n=1 Tax=Ischnura elegans TaxID=197161 RepID=UPI001ED88F26|nr:endocuticle structural glycoprotein SgAbd-9-like [Ischnura elegans]
MMKIAVLALMVSCVVAAPQAPLPPPPGVNPRFAPGTFVPILEKSFDLSPDGSYTFQYASADGSSRQESGAIRNPGTVAESNAVTGSYSYVADDGSTVTVNYIADENGFQPEGTSINPAITRSVAAQVQEAAAFRSGVVPAPLPVPVRTAPLPIPAATVAPVAPVRPIVPPGVNPAYYNPAIYNPGYYNPAIYSGYPGYRGYSGYRATGYPGYNPYYNPAYPNRIIPVPTPTAEAETNKA